MEKVLVLNSDYTPLSITNPIRAINLVIKQKAEIIKENERFMLRSEKMSFNVPSIIRVNQYVSIKFFQVVLSKKNIFIRDNHTCGYCGNTKNLTIDHIIPRSKGGNNDWTNLITCCTNCNKIKDDKSLEESNMKLKFKAYKPNYYNFFAKNLGKYVSDWDFYFFK